MKFCISINNALAVKLYTLSPFRPLSIYLSIHLAIHLYLFTNQSIYISVETLAFFIHLLPFFLPLFPIYIYLSIALSKYLSIYLSIHLCPSLSNFLPCALWLITCWKAGLYP